MDVALLFFLPLIGGFLFARDFLLIRYKTAREETQRVYYRAALYGIVFSAVGGALHYFLMAHSSGYASVITSITTQFLNPLLERPTATPSSPYSAATLKARTDLAIVCVWGLLMGFATPILNGLSRILDWLWRWTIGRIWKKPSPLVLLNHLAITDKFERFLADSLRSENQVQVTLSNGKVYVGLVTASFDPAGQTKYFKMQPFMSGYRSDDGRVIFTTFYEDILDRIGPDDGAMEEIRQSFQLFIPIDKVVTVSGFNFQAYEKFELNKEEETTAIVDEHEPNQHNTVLQGELRVRLIHEPIRFRSRGDTKLRHSV